jgi:hypothetical protein
MERIRNKRTSSLFFAFPAKGFQSFSPGIEGKWSLTDWILIDSLRFLLTHHPHFW